MGRPRWNGRAPPGSDVPGGSRLGIREFDRRFRVDHRQETHGPRPRGAAGRGDLAYGSRRADRGRGGRPLARWAASPNVAGRLAGVPALASVAILLCVSPVFSLEYAAWLIPWAAVAATEDPGATYALAVAAVEAATGLLAILYVGFAAESLSKILLILRNGLCLAISLAWLIGMPKRASGHLVPFGRVGRSDSAEDRVLSLVAGSR